jgi:CHASE2 domain-containing sensor protein
VHGPSGVGKSSLLRAGVVPEVRDNAPVAPGGSERVVVLVDSWKRDSLGTIRAALDAELARRADGEVEPVPASLTLADALQAYSERMDALLMLILDQFEEHFLYHPAADDALARELPVALSDPDVRARVVISLREDALAQLGRFQGAAARPFDNLLRLGPMTDERAREAIEEPIRLYGRLHPERPVEPDDGLAEHVLGLLHAPEPFAGSARGGAVREEGIEPAYLQLVMRRLWDREEAEGSATLRIGTLREMGGVREIVAEHLRENMDRLAAPEQGLMAKAFHYLVTPSGAKVAQRRMDLAKVTGASEAQIGPPLEKLSEDEARILRPVDDAPSYEVFHDVLCQPVLDWQARWHAERQRRKLTVVAILAGVLAAFVLGMALYLAEPDWLERRELTTVDARFDLRGAPAADPDIVVVDLDDAGLAQLGGGRAVIPRARHAQLIRSLLGAAPAVIVYDFEFRTASRDDRQVRAAFNDAGDRLVVAATLVDDAGAGLVLGQPARAPLAGFAAFPLSEDGAYREVDRAVGLSGAARDEDEGARLPSLGQVASEIAGDEPVDFERAWIDYAGPARTFKTFRFTDVLEGADTADFAGKIVIVGPSAARQGDLHPTEGGNGRVMPGAEIHANAISTLRRGLPVQSAPWPLALGLILLLALVPGALALGGVRAWVAAAVIVAVGAAYAVAAALLALGGTLVPVVYPLLALLAAGAAAMTYLIRLRE